MATPWTQYVSKLDQNFTVGTNMLEQPATTIYIGKKDELHACYSASRSVVTVWTSDSSNDDQHVMAPFSFAITPRRMKRGTLKILVHPIGLLHLGATGQIAPETYERLSHKNPSICSGTWLDKTDPIVARLKLRQVPLYVCTTADWSIVPA